MRRICTFVPALAITGALALGTTAGARPQKPAPRDATLPGGSLAGPNQVIVWNRLLLAILGTPGAQPATVHPTRSLAIMHLAIADAVDAVSQRFTPYHFDVPGPRGASSVAAAASAAHTALLALYPQIRPALDAQLAQSLAGVRNSARRSAGVAIGMRAARAVLRLREHDGSSAVPPVFLPGSAPGDYQPTPPAFAQPQLTNWAAVKPFALERADQFRPGPPSPPTSPEYAAALAEIRSVGELNSTSRTPDQTQIGQFWSAPIQNYWNQIAQIASLAHRDTLVQDARLFALLNLSFADDAVAFYDAKYTYRLWRPVTAVRADGIAADASWNPLVKTPPDPSYPGAHSVISFDAATILAQTFGDHFEFSVTSPLLPGVTRQFSRFSAAAEEAGLSRIYAGDHFRFDHAAGERLGRAVAGFVSTHELRLERSSETRR
jgi:hypothetical protein